MQWKTTAHKHAQSFDTGFHLKEFSASIVDFNERQKQWSDHMISKFCYQYHENTAENLYFQNQ